MHIPNLSPAARPDRHPVADRTGEQDHDERVELTGEEQAALAAHRRHVNETSYLPATADYLHVR